jgi:hypothetical protein
MSHSAGFSNGIMFADNVCFDATDVKNAQMIADGQLIIGRTGLRPTVATLTAGAGISITNGSGTITIANAGAAPSWNFISASQPMIPDNGYVCVSTGVPAAIVLPLPAVSAQGQEIEVYLDGATSWQITQGAGQSILYGNTNTTGGVGGSITSTSQGDSIRLLCVTANLRWIVLSGVGNPTII